MKRIVISNGDIHISVNLDETTNIPIWEIFSKKGKERIPLKNMSDTDIENLKTIITESGIFFDERLKTFKKIIKHDTYIN